MAFMSDMETIVIENTTDVRKLKDAFRSTAALDVETTTDNKDRLGDYFDPTFKIVSVQVTFDGKTAFVIPIYHNHYKEQYQVGLWQLVYPTLDQVDYWICRMVNLIIKPSKLSMVESTFLVLIQWVRNML